MMVNDSQWRSMMVNDGQWWLMAVDNGQWWLMTVDGQPDNTTEDFLSVSNTYTNGTTLSVSQLEQSGTLAPLKF